MCIITYVYSSFKLGLLIGWAKIESLQSLEQTPAIKWLKIHSPMSERMIISVTNPEKTFTTKSKL